MQSKNALVNLINRYKAVLNKCNFLNKYTKTIHTGIIATTFCTILSLAPVPYAQAFNFPTDDYYTIEQPKNDTNYYTTFNLVKNGISKNYGLLFKAGPSSTATFNTTVSLANNMILQNNSSYTIASGSGGLYDFNVNIDGQNLAYTVTHPSLSQSRIAALTTSTSGGVFYGITSASRGGAMDVNANHDLNINGTFIANNTGNLGGAISLWGSNNTTVSGTFIGNTAMSSGGAIASQNSSNNSISGIFIGNVTSVYGGAIYNVGEDNVIDGVFIGNSAKTWGGAIFNNGGSSINSISGTFIANHSSDLKNESTIPPYYPGGGAIFNTEQGKISSINANFIGNTSNYAGGAIINKGVINSINGIFIENTAKEAGGALQNFASTNASDAQIGYIDASFINNRTTGAGGLGGAIWTNRNLTFQANDRVNVFSGNMDSTGYNAIYVEDGKHDFFVSLNFNMLGNGGFIINDSIVTNGIDFYDVNINGEGHANSVFELNNTMSGVKTLSVNNARLRLGTVTQNGQDFVGRIYTRNASFSSSSIFEVPTNSGEHLISSGGTLNVAHGAKLHVLNTLPTWQVQPLTIVSGFDGSKSSVQGWVGSDARLVSPSSLQRLHVNRFDYISGTLTANVVNNTPAGINLDYPSMQYKTAQFLSNISADTYSQNAGVRLFSRAADERYVGRVKPKDATKVIEGALQIGNIAGLNKSGLDVGLVTSSSIQARLSPTGLGTASTQAPAVAMLDNNNVSAENGVAAGSHSVASGIQDGFALWLSPLYKHSFVHGHESGSFEHSRGSDIGGLTLGADYTFNEMFRVGLAFNLGTGFTRNNGDFDNTQNDFDFWNLSLYGAFYKNNFALLADVGLSKVFGDVNQDLPSGMQMSNLEASTESTVWTAGLRAEYTFMTSFMDITPYVGARYMHVQTHEYDVKSGGTAMSMEADNQGVWYFPVGVSFSKDIVTKDNWVITPKLDLGVIVATGDMDTTSSARVSGAGGVDYTMQNVDSFAFNGGLGLEIVKDDFSMGFNYNLQASQHETGHMLFATFKYSF